MPETPTPSAVTSNGAPQPDLSDIGLDGYAPYLMNRLMGRYNANLRKEMAGLGLTTAKMRVLAVLAVKSGLPIGALAVYAVVEQSTLSRALDGLQADGLITRLTDRDDQRQTRIQLTASGQAAYDRLWPHMADGQEKMFAGIDATERQAFVETLRKMLANIRHHQI